MFLACALVGWAPKAHSVGLADLGFEISGAMGSISPTEFNETFAVIDVDGMDRMYEVGLGTTLDFGSHARSRFSLGYIRSVSGQGSIMILNAPGPPFPPGSPTPHDYVFEAFPIGVGMDATLKNKSTALFVGVSLELAWARMTSRIDPQPAQNFEGHEATTNAVFPGIAFSAGVDWEVHPRMVFGVGGGYRLSRGDLTYPDGFDTKLSFDLSGGFAAAVFRFYPWRSAS